MIEIEGCKNQCEILDWFYNRRSTTICIMAGRGFGKSTLTRFMVGIQPNRFPGQGIIYASQSCSNSEDQFNMLCANDYVKSRLRPSSRYGEPFSKQPPTLHFHCGANCVFWSMERGDNKRGKHIPLVIVDEAQNISEEHVKNVLSPMKEFPGGLGQLVICGSCPKSESHWFWEMMQKGLQYPNDADVKSWFLPSTEAYMYQGEEGRKALAREKALVGEAVFGVEYLLIPKRIGDAYFKGEHIENCLLDDLPEPMVLATGSLEPTVLAYDPAQGSHDPAAYVVMRRDGTVLHSYSWPRHTDFRDKKADLIKAAEKYHSFVVVDLNGCQPVKDQVLSELDEILPFGVEEISLTKHEKTGYFDAFGLDLENKLVHIPRCFPELIKQLKHVESKKTPSGYLSIGAPHGEHDDELCCAILCREAIRRGLVDVSSVRSRTTGSWM